MNGKYIIVKNDILRKPREESGKSCWCYYRNKCVEPTIIQPVRKSPTLDRTGRFVRFSSRASRCYLSSLVRIQFTCSTAGVGDTFFSCYTWRNCDTFVSYYTWRNCDTF